MMKNRKRNKIINFRVSEKEFEEINSKILISGLSKSEYFIYSLLEKTITVYIGKFESDRLSLEFKKLNLTLKNLLENHKDNEIKILLENNLFLLKNILEINKKES